MTTIPEETPSAAVALEDERDAAGPAPFDYARLDGHEYEGIDYTGPLRWAPSAGEVAR